MRASLQPVRCGQNLFTRLMLLVVLFIAGCGGDDDGPSQPAATATAASPPVSGSAGASAAQGSGAPAAIPTITVSNTSVANANASSGASSGSSSSAQSGAGSGDPPDRQPAPPAAPVKPTPPSQPSQPAAAGPVPVSQLALQEIDGFAGNDTLAYLSDAGAAVIYRIDSNGNAAAFAGRAAAKGTRDGSGSTARFTRPGDLVLAADGTLYVLDANAVRRISPGGQVTTLAGNVSAAGYADGSGAQARFNQPAAMALGPDGNLYVADTENFLVRRVTPSGVVSTVAATQPLNARDSAGRALYGARPAALVVAPDGTIYFATEGGAGVAPISSGVTVIARLDASGEVTKVLEKQPFVKPELPSSLGAAALATDAASNVLFVSNAVYRLLAGGGGEVLGPVNPTVQAGQLAIGTGNSLWVTDKRSNRLLRLLLTGPGVPLDGAYFPQPPVPAAPTDATSAPPVAGETPASPSAPPSSDEGPNAPAAAPPSTDPASVGPPAGTTGDSGDAGAAGTFLEGTVPPGLSNEELAVM